MIIYNELKMGGGESIFEISEFGEEEKRGKYLLFLPFLSHSYSIACWLSRVPGRKATCSSGHLYELRVKEL